MIITILICLAVCFITGLVIIINSDDKLNDYSIFQICKQGFITLSFLAIVILYIYGLLM